MLHGVDLRHLSLHSLDSSSAGLNVVGWRSEVLQHVDLSKLCLHSLDNRSEGLHAVCWRLVRFQSVCWDSWTQLSTCKLTYIKFGTKFTRIYFILHSFCWNIYLD